MNNYGFSEEYLMADLIYKKHILGGVFIIKNRYGVQGCCSEEEFKKYYNKSKKIILIQTAK